MSAPACDCQVRVSERMVLAELAQRGIDANTGDTLPLTLLPIVRGCLSEAEAQRYAQLDAPTRAIVHRVAWTLYQFGVESGRELERLIIGEDHPGDVTRWAD